MAIVVPMDGQQQIERAGRLLDVNPLAKRTPVRKSLEQLFCESRGRAQSSGAVGALGGVGAGGGVLGVAAPLSGSALAGLSASRLLQTPQAQRLDREIADFSLSSTGAAPSSATLAPGTAAAVTATTPSTGISAALAVVQDQNVGVREFFALRHERVLLSAIEEAHRDCMQSLERHSFNRIQSDWEQAKAQIMSTMAPARMGAVGSALRGMPSSDGSGMVAMVAPPQDRVVIDALLREPMSQSLAQRVGRLSCDGCPAFQSEIEECWNIVAHESLATPRAIMCGALRYLQTRFATEIRGIVYGTTDPRLGGKPDAWSIVQAFGRRQFGASNFPSCATHDWYAVYVAARAGFTELLQELPDKLKGRSSSISTVCEQLHRRLQAVATYGDPQEFAAPGTADAADLLRSDLEAEANGFEDLLVSLLYGRHFAFGRLPDGTVEDWLWYRLHAVHIASQDNDKNLEFEEHLRQLRQDALAVPPSRYDPAVGGGAMAGPAVGPQGFGAGDVFMQQPAAASGGVGQTLNFVKVLLLTGQFRRAVQQLYSQDGCLRGPALHMALVLHRSGALDALAPGIDPEPALDFVALVLDYAGQFGCGDQLQYFRVLDAASRQKALRGLLLRGGVGTNDDLLGYIDPNGRHRPGLLEITLHEDGPGDGAEFLEICSEAGRVACAQGQYREAIRLLHLGRCYGEVLRVLCRCLQLPIWREPAAVASGVSEEAAVLAQDVERFFCIYERNLDRYALSPQAWSVARRLYGARMFHALCAQGRPEAALDIFDREQLLPLSPQQQAMSSTDEALEILEEQPRIVGDYVRILRHAASQGAVVAAALRERVHQLQAFLATQSHRLALDAETASSLASLALC